MAEGGDNDAVLSDIEGDDPSPIVLATGNAEQSSAAADHRVRELLAEVEEERRARKAAEDARLDLQTSFDRLKAVAHDIIKKRDEALKAADRAAGELSEAVKVKDEAVKQKDSLRSEMEAAAQMLVSGIDKISGKVSNFKNFSAGGLPRSNKYTGLPAVAYGVIKRTNEIIEELVKQIDASTKSRDQARELMEQRNFEVAIEVSQLEATIGTLREEVAQKGKEIENLEKLVADGNVKVSQMEKEMTELRQFGEECDSKLKTFETKLDSQRPLLIDQLNYISKAYEEIHGIIGIMNGDASNQSESSDSLFMWKEVDMDENLQTSAEGTKSVCELAKVALDKVREGMLKRNEEVTALNERVSELLAEKQHIGTLLRSALSSKTNEILQVAEDGLREAGIDLKLNGHHKGGLEDGKEDEVYTLAGALENTVKTSQLKIVELQHLVEALRAESGLLKAHLDTQAKEINQLKRQIKQLEEQERVANDTDFDIDGWEGWHRIWKLPIGPRVKVFLWRVYHDRIPTYALLHKLKIGPENLCPMCELEIETLGHLLNNCPVFQRCRLMIENYTGICWDNSDTFLDGNWLLSGGGGNRAKFQFFQALVATCAWTIWKGRCALVFRKLKLQAHQIFWQALKSTNDYFWALRRQTRELLQTSVYANQITVFCDASWVAADTPCGVGFVVIKGRNSILLAGASSLHADSSIQAEVAAIRVALEQSRGFFLQINRVFSDCPMALELLADDNETTNASLKMEVRITKHQITQFEGVEISYCPRHLNSVADHLAGYGRRNPAISLFHRGADRPRWLEEAILAANFVF